MVNRYTVCLNWNQRSHLFPCACGDQKAQAWKHVVVSCSFQEGFTVNPKLETLNLRQGISISGIWDTCCSCSVCLPGCLWPFSINPKPDVFSFLASRLYRLLPQTQASTNLFSCSPSLAKWTGCAPPTPPRYTKPHNVWQISRKPTENPTYICSPSSAK